MLRQHPCAQAVLCLLVAGTLGCQPVMRERFAADICNDLQVKHYKKAATDINYPDAHVDRLNEVEKTQPPRTLRNPHTREIWDLTLEEALRTALINSKVMRDLGARILTAPAATNTVYEPAIQESDPRFGVEAALSQFDTQFTTNMFWEKNDRVLNQQTPGLNPPVFQQDLHRFQAGFNKTAATGTNFFLRNNTTYDQNNNPNNRFPSAWETDFELGFQHPLLQGGGVTFNRIAGPNATPGFFFSNGVLIARVNNDVSLADFEAGVRRLVSDVENAYWDLYFAYRNLEARKRGRDQALEFWRRLKADPKSLASYAEAQARSQYYLFRGQLEDALSGVPGGSTQSGGGSSAGTFRGAGGVYARENNLRLLMGLTANDGRLIRPIDEPSTARVEFDWHSVLTEALCRRVELRRQKWIIKRRELELIAARNFLKPRLDAIGLYRWRGFGDNLIDPDNPGGLDNAFGHLTSGDTQEWNFGLQFTLPIGFRQAMAAVRHAELNLARERAVLQEQELQVSHDLTSAIRELHRAYQVTQTNYNRRLAAEKEVLSIETAYGLRAGNESRQVSANDVLEAHRRLADAETEYYRSLVEYNLAIKAVHFEKGSLLEYNSVALAEGPWPCKAYNDALKRARRRAVATRLNYGYTLPGVVSRGRYRQNGGEAEPVYIEEVPHTAPPEEIQPLPAPGNNDEQPLPMPVAERASTAMRQAPANRDAAVQPASHEVSANDVEDFPEPQKLLVNEAKPLPPVVEEPAPPAPSTPAGLEPQTALPSAVQPAVRKVPARALEVHGALRGTEARVPAKAQDLFGALRSVAEERQPDVKQVAAEVPARPDRQVQKPPAAAAAKAHDWSSVRRVYVHQKTEERRVPTQPARETDQPAAGWKSTKR